MSPLPVRSETKARKRPSGEKRGRDSVAGCETRSRATPPDAGTLQTSPPETNAISLPSGEMPGSEKEGRASATPPWAASEEATRVVARAASPNTRTMMHAIGRGAGQPVAVSRERRFARRAADAGVE